MNPRTRIALIAIAVISLDVSTRLIAQDDPAQSDQSAATTLANPVPFINQPLVPDAIKPGGAGFTLTVNGTGFVAGSVVKWNGSARTTTFVSRSKLKANIPTSDIATARTAPVTVVSPGPGGRASNVAFFEVTPPSNSVGLAAISYATAGSCSGVAVGDFNKDGNMDLVVANVNANSISVLLGNGDGTFQAHVDYATGIWPESVAVGDFNGDGKPDLAVANFYGNSISILLGNGDGTFQAQVEYATASFPSPVAVGDFNRDGKLDLAVASSQDNNVSVLLGNGDGTFQPPVNYSAGSGPSSVAVGDFNGDGRLDLVVADQGTTNGDNKINVLLGNGDGTFQPAVSYNTGPNPTSVAVADFNADGKLDLVVATNGNISNNTVSILLGNGDGTFQAHVDYQTGSSNPSSVAVGDFNGDGKLDLVVADLFSADVRLLLGNGNGTFGTAASYAAGAGSSSVAVGDFNDDGRLDIAVTDSGVSVLLHATTDSLSKTSLTFAPQTVGTISAPQTVTLTNTGTLTLTISSVAVTGTNASDYRQINTCDSSLPSGGKCTITVTFAPTDRGPRTASVTITDNTAGSPQSIALSGTGFFSGPNATLSTNSLTFATQPVRTTSTAQSVTLTNFGTASLSITSINFTGTDPADFARSTTCGSSLAPGASCTISVTFTPMQGGSRTATLAVADNAPFSPQTVSLKGTGTVVTVSPASLSFGVHPVGSSSTQATTLTNAGSTALRITGIVIAGADTDEFSQTNTCGTGVGAGKSCTITVTFRPKEKGGDGAEVSISDDDITSPQQVSLSGAGCVYTIYRGHRKCLQTITSPAVQSALAKSRSTAVPSVTGANRVGTRVLDLVDLSRIDPFATNSLNREVLVRFWYPASAEQDCKPTDYTSPRLWNYFAELTGLPLPAVSTNSCLNAPVADGEHPVVVFTHGYTGTFTDYTFLFEDLASRGYIVASIDHTYEATAVEFPDGRFVKSLVGSHLTNTWQTDDQTLSSALDVRLDDVKFVIDELERLNTSSGNAFAGKLDLTRLALAGHSLGGLTAWFGVQRDPRFKATVLLDPYLPDIPVGSTETPVILLTMGSEQRNEDECQLWSDLRGPRLAVNLRGAEHVTPSDLVWLAKGAVKTGPMGPEKTIAAVRDYIAAFLDTNVRGRPLDPLLTGPSAEFPDAEVTTQKQSLCGEAAAH